MTSGGGSERRGYQVLGRVQGVGFRWWTKRTAAELGLGGYVRNVPGGGVEVHAVGDPGGLDRFELLLREGPPAARVDEVSVLAADPGAPGEEFQILMS